jgi:hypothetical protein
MGIHVCVLAEKEVEVVQLVVCVERQQATTIDQTNSGQGTKQRHSAAGAIARMAQGRSSVE